jgi:hypothetical protein
MEKYNVIYLYNGILFGIKSNEVVIHGTTWVKLGNIVLRKSLTEKITYYVYFHLG